jgi:sugar lactone lactonase YvrE
MGLVGSSLFVADLDKLVEVNVETGELVKKHEFPEGTTLNDITVGDDGTVYASSSNTEEVFKWKDGAFEIIVDGDLGRPNGLFFEPGKLLMLTSRSSELKSIDLETKEVTVLASGFGAGDGLVPTGTGDYVGSDWKGQIFYIGSDWTVTQLLDSREQEIYTADIDYIIEKNMLLVPTFYDNRVVAYSIN